MDSGADLLLLGWRAVLADAREGIGGVAAVLDGIRALAGLGELRGFQAVALCGGETGQD